MAVPKQHDSKSKVGKRRSQKRLKKISIVPCRECKAPIRPHRMCPHCGYRPIAKKGEKEQTVSSSVVAKDSTETKEQTKEVASSATHQVDEEKEEQKDSIKSADEVGEQK